MAVAPNSPIPRPRIARPTSPQRRSPKSNRRVESLPKNLGYPFWLRSLLLLQRTSSLITLILMTATLATYGWTVYIQQKWAEQYRQLDTLQRRERQYTAASEILKHQYANHAETADTGLVAPNPANTVFLPSAPARPLQPVAEPILAPPVAKTPMGY